jgi:hypothetical protein
MNGWTKYVIMVSGFPVKVWVNPAQTKAVLFYLFGRYSRLSSDINVLDFATDFLLSNDNTQNVTFTNYLNGLEDTAVTEIEKIAA